MNLNFEILTHKNYDKACKIDRSDIPEQFVDNVSVLMDLTDYGKEHNCIGHTYLVSADQRAIGVILLEEAIPWETDPPQVKEEPFYRLMGFVIDKAYRRQGLGSIILEKTICQVYDDFGIRPIVLGCHMNNTEAAKFYIHHGFRKTDYNEGNNIYYIRYPKEKEQC